MVLDRVASVLGARQRFAHERPDSVAPSYRLACRSGGPAPCAAAPPPSRGARPRRYPARRFAQQRSNRCLSGARRRTGRSLPGSAHAGPGRPRSNLAASARKVPFPLIRRTPSPPGGIHRSAHNRHARARWRFRLWTGLPMSWTVISARYKADSARSTSHGRSSARRAARLLRGADVHEAQRHATG